MRDWNSPVWFIITFSLILCELNLWGIETVYPSNHSLLYSQVWIEPVRDWNHYFQLCIEQGFKECELNLWGIETHCKDWNSQVVIWVWIEPVRDWNITLLLVPFHDAFCVNWTCEGLKPNFPALYDKNFLLCELNLWGIETAIVSFGIQKCICVNWTCEGLKRDNQFILYPRNI